MANISKIKLVNNDQPYTLIDSRANGHMIFYGSCTTIMNEAAKVVNLVNANGFSLTNGTIIAVKFTHTNWETPATLNVNNTGAKEVVINHRWDKDSTILFVYENNKWVQISAQYNNLTVKDAEDIMYPNASTQISNLTMTLNDGYGKHLNFNAANAGISGFESMSSANNRINISEDNGIQLNYEPITGIAYLSGGLGWNIMGDYTNITGVSGLVMRQSGADPTITGEADSMTGEHQLIAYKDAKDPVDDYDVVNKKTYSTLASVGGDPVANNITDQIYDDRYRFMFNTDDGMFIEPEKEILDADTYLKFPNTIGRSSDNIYMLFNEYGISYFDSTKTYRITLIADGATEITNGSINVNGSGSTTISGNQMVYIGNVAEESSMGLSFAYNSNMISFACIKIEEYTAGEYKDGLLSGFDKEKYDNYENEIKKLGGAGIYYAICDTPAATVNKVATITNSDNFELKVGTVVIVKFLYNNSKGNPTLNINNTGALPLYQYGTVVMATANETSGWLAGACVMLTYDGNGWVRDQGFNTNSTYYYSSIICSTSSSTAAKTGTTHNYNPDLHTYIVVLMRNANTAKSALTLEVSPGTAKPIYINGEPSSTTNYDIPLGSYLVYYDGDNYYFNTDGKLYVPDPIEDNDAVNKKSLDNKVDKNDLIVSEHIYTLGDGTTYTEEVILWKNEP